MSCNCGKKNNIAAAAAKEQAVTMADNQYIRAKYLGSRGNHHIIGAFQLDTNPGLPSRKIGNKFVHYYGYASQDYITLVHKEDVRLMVGKWEVLPDVELDEIQETPKPEPKPIELPEPEPITVDGKLDLQTIPGVTSSIASSLEATGLDTEQAILDAGLSKLVEIKGIGEKRAELILKYLQEKK